MTIAFRNKTQGGGGTGTSLSLAAPTGLADNDILLYYLYKENTAAVTWGNGLTQDLAVTATNSSFVFYLASKRAASESGAYAPSWTGSAWRNGGLLAYSGCVATGVWYDATPVGVANGASSSGTAPTITSVTNGAMLVSADANFDGAFSTGYPSGMNGRVTQDNDIGIADLILTSAGASGTKIFSLTLSSQNIGFSIVLTPAAGAASLLIPGPRMPQAILAR